MSLIIHPDVTTLSKPVNDSADMSSSTALRSAARKLLSSYTKHLERSSAPVSATSWFGELILAFLKQVIFVASHTVFADDSKTFIDCRIEIFGNSSSLEALRLLITPWSIDWRTDVVFGGRKIWWHERDVRFVGGHGRCQPKALLSYFEHKKYNQILLPIPAKDLNSSNFFSDFCIGKEVA